jgi:hypothetical protein
MVSERMRIPSAQVVANRRMARIVAGVGAG